MVLTDPVKSARRALEVMEHFEQLKRPLGIAELATQLGYPLSSTSVLVNTLARLGYLNFDASTRKFAPTLRIALLGDWIVAGNPKLSRVKTLLQEARRVTGATSVLSTRNDIDVQYIHVVKGNEDNFRSRGPRMGTLRPLLRGSHGIVLMSGLSDEQIALLVRTVNATRPCGEAMDRVMEKVRGARREGYAWDAGDVYPDVGSVSVRIPLDDVFGKPLVLTIAGAAAWVAGDHAGLASTLKQLVARIITD